VRQNRKEQDGENDPARCLKHEPDLAPLLTGRGLNQSSWLARDANASWLIRNGKVVVRVAELQAEAAISAAHPWVRLTEQSCFHERVAIWGRLHRGIWLVRPRNRINRVGRQRNISRTADIDHFLVGSQEDGPQPRIVRQLVD
jgi:hypothetical protein